MSWSWERFADCWVWEDRPTRAELENDARIDADLASDRESFDDHYGPEIDAEFEESNTGR